MMIINYSLTNESHDEFVFVLHLDGVSHNEIPLLLQNNKSTYINVQPIFNSHASAHDDATVIVIKG